MVGSTAKGFAIALGILGGFAVLFGVNFALFQLFEYHTARMVRRGLGLVVWVGILLLLRHSGTGRAE